MPSPWPGTAGAAGAAVGLLASDPGTATETPLGAAFGLDAAGEDLPGAALAGAAGALLPLVNG